MKQFERGSEASQGEKYHFKLLQLFSVLSIHMGLFHEHSSARLDSALVPGCCFSIINECFLNVGGVAIVGVVSMWAGSSQPMY